jgi:ATP-dependent Clp protease ATP-binding subunit ClpA
VGFGARPLARVIREHIKEPLAEELLFGKLERSQAYVPGAPSRDRGDPS